MKAHVIGASVGMLLGSAAMAQQPVEWSVADGGNGHWYAGFPASQTWEAAMNAATALGGHLATPTTPEENQFLLGVALSQDVFQPWIGGYQDLTAPDYSEPAGGWRWVTGEPWSYENWGINEPDNFGGGESVLEFSIVHDGLWNDLSTNDTRSSLVEWSADCNGDGIVDYGQIQSGQLPDENGNNIPDCCEGLCCTGDLFEDGQINGADLGILLSQWGPATSATVSDLDGSGVVDGADLGILLAGWGPCPR